VFLDSGRWQLAGGVRLVSGSNEIHAESATLQVSGARAGELILQTTPPTTNTFLFSSIAPIPTPTPIHTASK
jgi:hypothetical protein